MAKIWLLDTETKGTGAEVVPLDKARRAAAADSEPVFVPRPARERPPEPPPPRPPRRFRVVDVMTRQILAEDADARAMVDVLRGVRRLVDVTVYVWEDTTRRWRLLTLGEQRSIWELRDR